jgi:hypothetical protein
VKYPYPVNIITHYKKEFRNEKGAEPYLHKDEAFNLEKEHKIINPHNMDLKTTTRLDYKPFAVVP